jgi:hypothetical protein
MPDKIMDMKTWESVNWDSKEDRKKVMGALAHFLNAPYKQMSDHAAKLRAKMQEFTTTGDFPQTNLIEIMKSFQSQVHFDTGYQDIFDVRDFTGTNQSGYDILDVTAGLTFDLKLPGEKIDVYTMSGTKVRVYFNYYGGGLGWHQILIDDREYWQMENTAREFRNKAFSAKAQAHYTLIEAVPAAQNIAWQLPVDAALPNTARNYTAERDVATINLACQTLFQNNKNKGYNLDRPQSTEFILLAPLELAQRVNNAMKLHLQAFEGSVNQAVYRWRPIITDMFAARNVYYVILPKEKSISVDRMNLTMFEDFDITNLVHTMAGWFRYGAAIGDTQQYQRCAIA